MKNKITQSHIVDMVEKHKDHLYYNRQYIQEIQMDTKEGKTEATLELYYTDDGYIYNIAYTDETTGNYREFAGQEADELARKLLDRESALIEDL
jgi:hypothetical protein